MTWFWGVDTSTKAVDIVAWDHSTNVHFADWGQIVPARESFQGATSLRVAYQQTLVTASRLIGDIRATSGLRGSSLLPSLIVVESPFVRGGGQSLLMTYGAILAALATVANCPIVEVPSATWKATYPGRGNADKEQVMCAARQLGYKGDRQDSADALCMTQHAYRLWRRDHH